MPSQLFYLNLISVSFSPNNLT